MKFWGKSALLTLVLGLVLAAGAWAALEKAELINGTHWSNMSEQDKLIYIRGMTNWADFVVGAQPHKARGWEFCISQVLVNDLKTKSLGQIVAEVDAFYRENPQKLDTSVIEVVLRRCTKSCPPETGAKQKKP